MTAKRFTIVDEQFISYYGGTGHLISNGECEIWLWHSKEASQKVCNKLNSILDENEQLKARITYLERKIQRERVSAMKQHEKWENELKATIKEAYENERTQIGKNVLKQLIEQME